MYCRSIELKPTYFFTDTHSRKSMRLFKFDANRQSNFFIIIISLSSSSSTLAPSASSLDFHLKDGGDGFHLNFSVLKMINLFMYLFSCQLCVCLPVWVYAVLRLVRSPRTVSYKVPLLALSHFLTRVTSNKM